MHPVGASQANYPRVSFLAAITASNVNRQLEAIQADMRSNLTAHFAPVLVAVTFSLLPSSGGRRLLEGKQETSSTLSTESSKLLEGLTESLPEGTSSRSNSCQDQARFDVAKPIATGMHAMQKRQTGSGLSIRQAKYQTEDRQIGGSHLAAQSFELSEKILSAAKAGEHTRQLLQSGSVNLQVNVTFPSTSQNSASQGLATAFNQALQSNPSSVLGGFEQGYGSVGVTSVALSYVTASDSGLGSPPASTPTGSGDGSVGTFVGIAVAAVLALTLLAGKLFPSTLLTDSFSLVVACTSSLLVAIPCPSMEGRPKVRKGAN